MNLLFDVLLLAGAVLFFILMSLLRTILSFNLSGKVVKVLPPDFEAPESWRDLYEEARASLLAAGFSETAWLEVGEQQPQPGEPPLLACLFSRPEDALQFIVFQPLRLDAPNALLTMGVSWLKGVPEVMVSQSNNLLAERLSSSGIWGKSFEVHSVTAHLAAHEAWRQCVVAEGNPALAEVAQLPQALALLFGESDQQELIAAGKLWRDAEGVARPTLRLALWVGVRMLPALLGWRARRKQADPAAPGAAVTTATSATSVIAGAEATAQGQGKPQTQATEVAEVTVEAAAAAAVAGKAPAEMAEAGNNTALPVPPERLLLLLERLELEQSRPCPRRWQWGLLVGSGVLSVALGSLFFGWVFTVMILLVILFHEAGHYWAMKRAGYRNVSIVALPLLGGVTTGVEVQPTALKRAWVAMMGPLPGIVLGWGLVGGLAWFLLGPVPEFLLEMGLAPETLDGVRVGLDKLVLLLLFVNYLNLLPIFPLDGGHIVQAILPPRWLFLRLLFIALGLVLAAGLAWYAGFYIIALLALLPLPRVYANLIRDRRLMAALLDDPKFLQAAPRAQKAEILRHLLAQKPGVLPVQPLKLVLRVQSLYTQCAQQPMRAWGRGVTGGVYLGLLLLPLLFVFLLFSGGLDLPFPKLYQLAQKYGVQPYEPEPEAEATRLRRERYRTLFEQAYHLPKAELVADLLGDTPPQPASLEMIRAAEARLGMALPEELVALYQLHDGLPAMKLPPVAQLGNTPRDAVWQAQWQQGQGPKFEEATYPADARMVYLGESEVDSPFLYLYHPETGGIWHWCFEHEGADLCVAEPHFPLWSHLWGLWARDKMAQERGAGCCKPDSEDAGQNE